MSPRVTFCISSHGLGHLSQISAVLASLIDSKSLQLAVRSQLPSDILRQWEPCEFVHEQVQDDVGMVMNDALTVDVAASYSAYKALHGNWDEKVAALAEHFVKAKIELVVSDVAYLPLAAAKKAGIPGIGLCSLNWAEVIKQYFPNETTWLAQAQQSYLQADYFIAPAPAMPMPWLTNKISIGPIGRKGSDQRAALVEFLGLPPKSILVLIGMGGVTHPLDLSLWPSQLSLNDQQRNIFYITPSSLSQQISNSVSSADLPFSYADVIASSDVVITKPGYGMFVEVAAVGKPVLYVERTEWPDVDSLTAWIHQVTLAREISAEALQRGSIGDAIAALIKDDKKGLRPSVELTGAAEAADIIKQYLL